MQSVQLLCTPHALTAGTLYRRLAQDPKLLLPGSPQDSDRSDRRTLGLFECMSLYVSDRENSRIPF